MQYLITGNTYLLRREIKSLFNGFWDNDKKGWIATGDVKAIADFCEKNGLDYESVEGQVEQESKIDQRIRYCKKRLEKWSKKELRAEGAIDNSESKINGLTNNRDWAIISQPILVGHHSEGRHRRMKAKIWRESEKTAENFKIMEDAQDKQEYREKELKKLEAQKAGTWKNAGARRDDIIAERSKMWNVGDKVDRIGWSCVITKKNAKSCKIRKHDSEKPMGGTVCYSMLKAIK